MSWASMLLIILDVCIADLDIFWSNFNGINLMFLCTLVCVFRVNDCEVCFVLQL